MSELHNQRGVDDQVAKQLPDLSRHHTASSDWLFDVVRPFLADVEPFGSAYERDFDRFEVLVGLTQITDPAGAGGGWTTTGRFTWRGQHGIRVADDFLSELKRDAGRSPLVGPLFESGDELVSAVERYRIGDSGHEPLLLVN